MLGEYKNTGRWIGRAWRGEYALWVRDLVEPPATCEPQDASELTDAELDAAYHNISREIGILPHYKASGAYDARRRTH